MPNKNKAKGDQFERDVIALWKRKGFERASRNALTGQANDMGDVLGIPNLTVQCKNYKDVAVGLRHAIKGASEQVATAGNRWYVGLVKNHRQPIQKTYAVMPLHMFIDLYRLYREAIEENNMLKQQMKVKHHE